ncbi:MAG: hypothetical protein AB8F95_01210, partial [Bacteroidia bacterium]
DPGFDDIETPPMWLKDSTIIEYNGPHNQITRLGNKVFTYDTRGNCTEWKIENPGLHCGNATTHWKGTYDEENNLIDHWSDDISFQMKDSSGNLLNPQVWSALFIYDSLLYDNGRLHEEKTYFIDRGDTSLWSIEYYEWFE